MPLFDQLFPGVLGADRLVPLEADGPINSGMLGSVVKLGGHTLALAALQATGFFVIAGPGNVSGALEKELTENQALLVTATPGALHFVEQPDVDLVALTAHLSRTDNPHAVTKAQVGLGSVDNTPDSQKPVSAAQQQALDLKAPLHSPAFTGNPTVPTQAENDDSTRAASTAFVKRAMDAIDVGGSGAPAVHSHSKFQVNGLATELDAKLELPVGVTISGALSPDATGTLIPCEGYLPDSYPGARSWSTDGNSSAPGSDPWVRLYRYLLITPQESTLDLVAPPENYTATGSQTTASVISVNQSVWPALGVWKNYWLYDNGVDDPYWVDIADPGMSNAGAAVIPAGVVVAAMRSPSAPFAGGLLREWYQAADALFAWILVRSAAGTSRYWYGKGASVDQISGWAAGSPATGEPGVEVLVNRYILPTHADDAAARLAGLGEGMFYFDGSFPRAVVQAVPPLSGADAPQSSGLVVSGAVLAHNGGSQLLLPHEGGLINGRPVWGYPSGIATNVYWDGSKWVFFDVERIWHGAQDVANPADVSSWVQIQGVAAALAVAERATAPDAIGQEYIKSDFSVYKCARVHPAVWVRIGGLETVITTES